MKNIGYRCSSRKEDPEERLGRLAARQWGVFGRQQVLEAGLSVQALDRRLQSGAWQRVHPRVYRMRGAPVSWQQRLMAAQLWRSAVPATYGFWPAPDPQTPRQS